MMLIIKKINKILFLNPYLKLTNLNDNFLRCRGLRFTRLFPFLVTSSVTSLNNHNNNTSNEKMKIITRTRTITMTMTMSMRMRTLPRTTTMTTMTTIITIITIITITIKK